MADRRFNERLAGRLDLPERVTWLPPDEVIRAVGVQSGEIVADVGAGTGYFSLPLAQAVGSEGRVYALDAQCGMLERLKSKLESCPALNIECVRAEADAMTLPDATCDLMFLANVWHEFEDRKAVIEELKRILRRAGSIAILDWRPDVTPEHRPPLEHRLSSSSARAELKAMGFARLSEENIGRYSWLVLGSRAVEGWQGHP